MSFILDALKKSETERQHKGSAEFANVPTSGNRRERPPAWLWVLGILLLVNIAVLAGILLRPDVGLPVQVTRSVPAVEQQPVSEPQPAAGPRAEFASRVAAARDAAPATQAPAPVKEAPAMTSAAAVENVSTTVVTARQAPALRTIQEVRAQGLVSLPDLHVDIHVYSETPRDRFVFINMIKQNEGSRLPDGPLVEEITPEGVILSMNGVTFLLPRD